MNPRSSRHLKKRQAPRAWSRRALALALLASAALPWGSALAQSDPTSIGVSQRPYVLILMDSSASMEFTTEEDGAYPVFDNGNPSNVDVGVDRLNTWSPEKTLNGGDSNDYGKSDGLRLVGPCYVWEPRCNQYDRPAWYPGDDKQGRLTNDLNPRSHNESLMNNRLLDMRSSITITPPLNTIDLPTVTPTNHIFRRLRDQSQPRHVQLKEILTGDMILLPRQGGDVITSKDMDLTALDPQTFGPGCWFVPRMHGARIGEDTQDLCFDSTNKTWDWSNPAAFQNYVDFDDPRPHLQEVFDFQFRTGLIDNFANTAIFAVALFDGYPGRLSSGAITHELPDRPRWPNDGTTADLSSHPNAPVEAPGQAFNLGVHKIVGPKTLWKVSSSELPVVAEFTQLALVDAGYLRNQNVGPDKNWTVDPDKPGDHKFKPFSFSKLDKKKLPVYYAGQQAMGGGTPLAAAIYDIHNFMINGQAEFRADGTPESYASIGDTDDGPGDDNRGYNPIQNDRYKMCRPKHVIVMTDGAPAPERPGGVNDIGTNFLNKGFGYDDALTATGDPERYRYETAEVEIRDLVTDPQLNPPSPDPRYQPHVHIVGLMPLGASVPAAERAKIAEKLGAMAAEGGTCAEYWLTLAPEGRAFIPASWGTGGTCDDANPASNCLVAQLPGGKLNGVDYIFPPPTPVDPTPVQITCRAPALLLSLNDSCSANSNCAFSPGRETRDDLTFALSLIFNQVLDASGGIASRTRPGISNSIDTALKIGQHRVYSGVQISGGRRYWKGLLNREDLLCAGDETGAFAPPVGVKTLHEEINAQVKLSGINYTDNRRIFTSVKVLDPVQPQGIPTSNAALTDTIFTDYSLMGVLAARDEFRGTTLLNPQNVTRVVGRRIPVEASDLAFAVTGISNADDPGVNWQDLMATADASEARAVIKNLRGHTPEKKSTTGTFDAVFGPILNSNPVILEPPARDLPIDSYRAYRERFERRPTMLFASTLDGLLHAVYTGEHDGTDLNGNELKIMQREQTSNSSGGDTPAASVADPLGGASQREAWAYAPELLRKQFARFQDRQPNLLDGGILVRDVRLCHERAELNQNQQACQSVATGTTALPGSEQWRSVLVASLGQAGRGYFALDVTRTGQLDASNNPTVPDPIPLWEFGPDWEQRQLAVRVGQDFEERFSSATLPPEWNTTDRSCLTSASNVREMDLFSFMGVSTSDAEIATVILDVKTGARVQRPVAIFGAGLSSVGDSGDTCLRELRHGRALYVVDLQTGTMLRRFVSYFDEGIERRLETDVSGSPTAYNNVPGTVANRAFVGDAWGRLLRVDMSDPDMRKWRMDLMYDPCRDDDLRSSIAAAFSSKPAIAGAISSQASCQNNRDLFGEASFRPAVALGQERNVVITYGLGDRTDTGTADKVQALITLTEKVNDKNASNLAEFTLDTNPANTVLWRFVMQEGEKLTGEPVIFNRATYFTSYVENLAEPCEAGTSRVYGLAYEGDGSGKVKGALDKADLGFSACPATGIDGVLCGDDPLDNNFALWTGPEEPALMRGLTITLGPVCSLNFADPSNQVFSEQADPQPTLLATMGGSKPPTNTNFGGGNPDPLASTDLLARFKVQLRPPRSQLLPLSYVSLGQ